MLQFRTFLKREKQPTNTKSTIEDKITHDYIPDFTAGHRECLI